MAEQRNVDKQHVNKVVLAYSGGLDTSIIVPWLIENYDCEVICYTADLGQGQELEGLEQKALQSGASKIIIDDLREQFLTEFVFPTMQAGAVYEHKYLLGTSFARPLIAKRQVEIAEQEGADAIAHGCTGKGNDQVRFEVTAMALNPTLKVIAPWREWDIRSREDALEYARAHNVPVAQTEKSIYSRDANIWHMSHEGGLLEDPWQSPEEEMYQLSVSPEEAPDEPEIIELEFESGVPVGLNGERMGADAGAERDRRAQRHWPHRPRREPAGGYEVARHLRDARRHAAVRRPPRTEEHLPGQRHPALETDQRAALC